MRLVSVKELKEGMILADDLIHQQTGAILLSKGVKLNRNLINSLLRISNRGYCLVEEHYGESTEYSTLEYLEGELEDEVLPAKAKKHVSQNINFPTNQEDLTDHHQVFEQLSNLYREVYHQVEEVYERSLKGKLEINKLQETSIALSREINRNPEILLQIALLKEFDNYTFSHAVRVSIYSAVMANKAGMAADEVYQINLAGLLHDLGKMEIPDEILHKPGPLSSSEWEIMVNHVEYGVNRLKNIPQINPNILQAVAQHHERVDGSGYPRGISGKEIHPWGKILATTDVYDAVTSDRVYKRGVLPHLGAEILMSHANNLDWETVNTFIKSISFYPEGTIVKLNTGEICKVVQGTSGAPFRPILQILHPPEKSPGIVNLTEELTTLVVEIIKYPPGGNKLR